MRFDTIPVFASLKGAMQYHSARAEVLAQNVANVQTPDFTPSDIADGDVGAALRDAGQMRTMGVASPGLAVTNAAHMQMDAAPPARFTASKSPDSETTLDGNGVVIEEQIARVAATRSGYEMAVSLYQKSLGLLLQASRPPSG